MWVKPEVEFDWNCAVQRAWRDVDKRTFERRMEEPQPDLETLGERLMANGCPEKPTNREMQAYSLACLRLSLDAANYETFVNNFPEFLEELSSWQQRYKPQQ